MLPGAAFSLFRPTRRDFWILQGKLQYNPRPVLQVFAQQTKIPSVRTDVLYPNRHNRWHKVKPSNRKQHIGPGEHEPWFRRLQFFLRNKHNRNPKLKLRHPHPKTGSQQLLLHNQRLERLDEKIRHHDPNLHGKLQHPLKLRKNNRRPRLLRPQPHILLQRQIRADKMGRPAQKNRAQAPIQLVRSPRLRNLARRLVRNILLERLPPHKIHIPNLPIRSPIRILPYQLPLNRHQNDADFPR